MDDRENGPEAENGGADGRDSFNEAGNRDKAEATDCTDSEVGTDGAETADVGSDGTDSEDSDDGDSKDSDDGDSKDTEDTEDNKDNKDNKDSKEGDGKGSDSKKKKKKITVKKIILAVAITVLAAVLLTVAAGALIINHYLGQMEYVDPSDTGNVIRPEDVVPGMDGEEGDQPQLPQPQDPGGSGNGNGSGSETGTPETEVQWPDADDITYFEDDKLINIMIVGQDRREGMGRMHSDTMILVSINPDTRKASLISFLRDTWVPIPGYWDERLNVAYFYGGFPLMKDTIKQNFGVTIDGCFEVDFYDFIEIIDMLGGVEMDVTQAESDHMRDFMGVEVPVGHSRLNGEQALAFARIRKIDWDFTRTERQRRILLSLFDEFKDASVFELKGIADKIMPKLATDMTLGERWGLLIQLLPMVSKLEISTYSVPTWDDYTRAFINGNDVLVPDLVKIRERLANTYLPF